jgi:hypothetical protein
MDFINLVGVFLVTLVGFAFSVVLVEVVWGDKKGPWSRDAVEGLIFVSAIFALGVTLLFV